jgi:hypothetical protein
MPIHDPHSLVPVVPNGLLICTAPPDAVRVHSADGGPLSLMPVGRTGQSLIRPKPGADFTIDVAGQPPLGIQIGDWSGLVDQAQGAVISGWARNLRKPGQDTAVIAWSGTRVVAVAPARAAEAGRFIMVLPPEVTGTAVPLQVQLGIAGSDCLLEGGLLHFGPDTAPTRTHMQRLIRRPTQDLAMRIKISTPNLKEAPMWGDYHFANSLAASFGRQGRQADVDTADAWYAHSRHEDIALAIRGRHRFKVDKSRINILWIISHPDRIPEDEFADYDHVAVASDVYAAALRNRGLPSVSVLHQATDSTLFQHDPDRTRSPTCLFVGNSRREYRTMIRWCIQKNIPLELHGGGWDGVLPDGMLRGTSIANADLPQFYGNHLILLNDHWDSMRENGFLSNRLFDGSGVATPILTDTIAGLSDVFGDTISEAADKHAFADVIADCLNDPAPYLERALRAHQIVMAAHTFDHRARQIADIVDRIAARKRRMD